MTSGLESPSFVRTRPARVLKTLHTEIARAHAHFGLSASALVRSCYEAGRDGFWLDRYLVSRGVTNSIVDSSSIEVNCHVAWAGDPSCKTKYRITGRTARRNATRSITRGVRLLGGS